MTVGIWKYSMAHHVRKEHAVEPGVMEKGGVAVSFLTKYRVSTAEKEAVREKLRSTINKSRHQRTYCHTFPYFTWFFGAVVLISIFPKNKFQLLEYDAFLNFVPSVRIPNFRNISCFSCFS